MLNSEMKKRIDDARDILVWKIPVPSQQIEQITIALIYKFMSDIDKQDKELWGDWFFQWEYEQYSWDKVMDRKLWWQERLKLYSEWLDNLDKNPYLPQMFRDIFKNAYLPFKDPATLDMFLKQIDKFSYDHSEDLWDAFEYLLSTAWSQWDAGQFRTPRHIIDFIVSIVQPEFNDTVLDPACWTAWFLISAYKYILNQNKDKVAWDKLSLTQKKSLTEHFVGYDISPEMVKLSLVNMYLHNFGNPKIYEYDTLSDDSKWDNRFDCILANPPFMTPKWWIQPHNRFSIKASKSEVLFVDYMIEHLNPNWKAWIVVPEWIIFQSANAYKNLRKKMIKENFLWAVVSLPTWVFQPYSWVKTSILLFDQELSKKTDKILFVKVQNDGFDLWAQRRPINKNDIPKATEILLQYKKDLLVWNEINLLDSEMNLLVTKEKIEENSEFNLSMDRYRETWPTSTQYEIIKLSEVATISSWNSAPQDESLYENWIYPFFRTSDVWEVHLSDNLCKTRDYLNEEWIIWLKLFKKWTILFPKSWASTFLNHRVIMWVDWYVVSHLATIEAIDWKVLWKYLYYVLTFVDAKSLCAEQGYPSLRTTEIWNIEIPLPPLEVQEKIVAELDGYQKVIDWAKMIVDNYKPTIKINPDWEMVKFWDLYLEPSKNWLTKPTSVRGSWYKMVNMGELFANDKIWNIDMELVPLTDSEKTKNWLQENDLLFARQSLTIQWAWKCSIVTEIREYTTFESHIIRVRLKNNVVNPYFYFYYLNSENSPVKSIVTYNWQAWIRWSELSELSVFCPPLDVQNQIVAEIEKEEAMVENAKQLIEVFEKKIKDKIDEIWGK